MVKLEVKNFMIWSAIIPARNEEKALSDCVDSVKKQKGFFDIEIVVVDNGSTDKTKEIAGKLGVKIVDEPRHGVGQARKT